MTNDTKAPERIWAGPHTKPCGASWTYGDWDIDDGDSIEYAEYSTEYIRHDHALALVAAALRENCVICCGTGKDARGHDCGCGTPSDAQAALEMVKQEAWRDGYETGTGEISGAIDEAAAAKRMYLKAREEALREAAGLCRTKADKVADENNRRRYR